MTKLVRIENADTSNYGVLVRVEDKNAEGEWVNNGHPDTVLNHPTSMTAVGITSTRRLVIEEVPPKA